MIFQKNLFLILALLISCNHIKTADNLSNADIERIQKLNLLSSGETIYKFYSEYKTNVAGNFFTNKRIARYWIDESDKKKNSISSAFYPDIQSIDTVVYAGLTYSPYMLVTKKDSSQFKIAINGKKEEIRAFFEEALKAWKQNKN